MALPGLESLQEHAKDLLSLAGLGLVWFAKREINKNDARLIELEDQNAEHEKKIAELKTGLLVQETRCQERDHLRELIMQRREGDQKK